MPVVLALLILFLLPLAARAESVSCRTSILGQSLVLDYDRSDPALRENRTYRERVFGRFGRITCPGYATLRYLTPGLTEEERSLFCLSFDKEQSSYTGFEIGPRDAYASCRLPARSFCQRVNATAADVMAISGAGARVAIDATTTVVENPVAVMTGTSATILGTLGSVGSGLVAALSAPATLAAAAVTVVTVGGVVYVCSE